MALVHDKDAKMTAEEYRDKANECEAAREESFQRCDTDGFLSQWASGMTSQLARAKEQLAEDGWLSDFQGLYFIKTGERAAAKPIKTKYGWRWAFVDKFDRFIEVTLYDGRTACHVAKMFLPYRPKRAMTLGRYGLCEFTERVPANARLASNGTGLSGNCWVEVYREDRDMPDDEERQRLTDEFMMTTATKKIANWRFLIRDESDDTFTGKQMADENQEHLDLLWSLSKLAVGETHTTGGGAWATFVIERVQ